MSSLAVAIGIVDQSVRESVFNPRLDRWKVIDTGSPPDQHTEVSAILDLQLSVGPAACRDPHKRRR